MNKREKNRLRDRVLKSLSPTDLGLARSAWHRAWEARPHDVTNHTVDEARFAMILALDGGQTIRQAEKVALARLRQGAVE